MALSKRLFSIFSMVQKGSIVADIGCDHGLLSISLIEEGICQHVYACDLRKGPLSRTKDAIHQAGLEKNITPILSDGLEQVPNDITGMIVAGMGQETIEGILMRRMQLVQSCDCIVIQANKNMDAMRRWISVHGFTILNEDIVEEDHFYEVLCFNCTPHTPYSEDEILFGTRDDHPMFIAYWMHRIHKIDLILQKMPQHVPMFQEYISLKKRMTDKIQEKKSF